MTSDFAMAWLLHQRPYREHGVIAEFLVADLGRLAMVVSGVRKARSSRGGLLQPFRQLAVSWRGRGELKILVALESVQVFPLAGQALLCGFYLNELLLRAIIPGQPDEGITALYAGVVEQLAAGQPLEPLLRFFELELLSRLGYLPSLSHEATTGRLLVAEQHYAFLSGVGLVPLAAAAGQRGYSGAVLKALAARDFSRVEYYPFFKQFTRQALTAVTGERPLKSRELFVRGARVKTGL